MTKTNGEFISDSEFHDIVIHKVSEAKDIVTGEDIKILPWIGSNYARSPCPILICGESVWNDTEYLQAPYEPREIAIRVTEEGRWRKANLRSVYDQSTNTKFKITGNFTGNLFWYLTGHRADPARKLYPGRAYVERWEEWAFWELIQERLETKNTRPCKSQWGLGFTALREVIHCLRPRPKVILGLGYGMADRFTEFRRGNSRITTEGDRLFRYEETIILFVKHPSSIGKQIEGVPWQEKQHDMIEEVLRGIC